METDDVNSIKKQLKRIDLLKVDLILTLSKAASFRPHYAVNKLPYLHLKWMAYIHDPYPFSKYPKPYDWKEPGHKIKERFFNTLSKNAKYTAFPSLLLKEWMASFFNNFNNTGIIIPHQIISLNLKEQKPKIDFDSSKIINILNKKIYPNMAKKLLNLESISLNLNKEGIRFYAVVTAVYPELGSYFQLDNFCLTRYKYS